MYTCQYLFVGSHLASGRLTPNPWNSHSVLEKPQPCSTSHKPNLFVSAHHPTQLVREDGQSLPRAVLGLQLCQARLEAFVLLGAEHRSLGERPLQPGVAALGVAHTSVV